MTTATKVKPMTTQPFENAAAQAKEQYEGFVKAGQEQVAKTFEQTAAATKEQVDKLSAQLLKAYADLQALSKGNAEAVLQSTTIATQGAEDLSRELTAYAQASFDKSITTGKALLTAKSLKEVVDLQTDFVKSSFDAFVAEASRLQDLTSRLTDATLAPLNARVDVTVKTLSKPLAA
ncbi:phasin family protein [Azospirillum sp. sgz302134]